MSEQVGIDQYLYRNTGTWASPTWTLIENVRDLTMDDVMGEADVSRRAISVAQFEPTLRKISVNFDMVYDPDDADFAAIQTAYTTRAAIIFAFKDSAIATAGNYLKVEMKVFEFKHGEPLEGANIYSVSLKPCYGSNAPTVVTVS